MTSDQGRRLSEHLARRGITDDRVLDAIAAVPREAFVPEDQQADAYEDTALPIGSGQTISQPYIVALMTEALRLTGDEKVLEVGTGSGYQTAVLCRLCREVVTIERLPELADDARAKLDAVGCHNVRYYVGDGTLGCPEEAPFDAILVTAAAPEMPAPLYEQLRIGGRLLIPIGDESLQTLMRIERRLPEPLVEDLCACRFVKLIGEAGWPAEED
jgi:protein-L-isoaspartate(D-aspartate) O-methyltransferase